MFFDNFYNFVKFEYNIKRIELVENQNALDTMMKANQMDSVQMRKHRRIAYTTMSSFMHMFK